MYTFYAAGRFFFSQIAGNRFDLKDGEYQKHSALAITAAFCKSFRAEGSKNATNCRAAAQLAAYDVVQAAPGHRLFSYTTQDYVRRESPKAPASYAPGGSVDGGGPCGPCGPPGCSCGYPFAGGGIPGGIPGGIAGGMPGGIPGGMPGGIAGGIAGGMPGGIAGGIAGGIVDWNPGPPFGNGSNPPDAGPFPTCIGGPPLP